MFKLHRLSKAAIPLMAWLTCACLFADDLKIAIREPRSSEELREEAKLVKDQFSAIITKAMGFQVFDRASADQIMDEHYQVRRSGHFSEDEARALGEFKGADFVITSELTLLSDGAIRITAQAISIVSARVVGSANKLVEMPSSKTIMEACQDLCPDLMRGMLKAMSSRNSADAPESMIGDLEGEIKRVLMNNKSIPKWNTNKNSYSLEIDTSGLTIEENRQFGNSRVSGRIYFTLTDYNGNGGGAELEIKPFTEMGKALIQKKIREQVQQKAPVVIRDLLSELGGN
jgi:hypothetical protein